MRKWYGEEFLNHPPIISEMCCIIVKLSAALSHGCIDSMYCMDIAWKNYPRSWKGQYRTPKKGKLARISMEAMCDILLNFWHVHCEKAGSNNNITVAESIPQILEICSGKKRMKLPEGKIVQRNVHD